MNCSACQRRAGKSGIYRKQLDQFVNSTGVGNGHVDEGAAFVYFGTARGRLVRASQFRGDGTSPVQPWAYRTRWMASR